MNMTDTETVSTATSLINQFTRIPTNNDYPEILHFQEMLNELTLQNYEYDLVKTVKRISNDQTEFERRFMVFAKFTDGSILQIANVGPKVHLSDDWEENIIE